MSRACPRCSRGLTGLSAGRWAEPPIFRRIFRHLLPNAREWRTCPTGAQRKGGEVERRHSNEQARIVHLPRGTVLFRPDDACSGFVVVHAGTVKVSLLAENGREIVLYRVRPGEICLQTFGCLVNHSMYSAEGLAETDLSLEVIPAGEFQRRVAEDAAFRARLFAAVANRFADLERLVEDVALSSVAARLARALLRLQDGAGVVTATHEALATEIGSARAVVSRQLGQFSRDGLIASGRGHIAIAAPEALALLSHDEG